MQDYSTAPVVADAELEAAMDDMRTQRDMRIDLVGPPPSRPAPLRARSSLIVQPNAVEAVEALALDRARRLFSADYASMRPASTSAALALIADRLLKRGDGLLTVGMEQVFLPPGSERYRLTSCDPDIDSGRLDYDRLESLALYFQPRLITVGIPPHARGYDWAALRRIAEAAGARLVVDMSTIAGGVAAHLYDNPVASAHAVVAAAESLPGGLRGGLLLIGHDAELADRLDRAVADDMPEAPLPDEARALAAALGRCMQLDHVRACRASLTQAQTMVRLLRGRAFDVISGGTDDQRFLIDLRRQSLTGRRAVNALDAVHVGVRAEALPGAPGWPFASVGLVVDATALGDRGFDDAAARQLAGVIADVLEAVDDAEVAIRARRQVRALCERFATTEQFYDPEVGHGS